MIETLNTLDRCRDMIIILLLYIIKKSNKTGTKVEWDYNPHLCPSSLTYKG